MSGSSERRVGIRYSAGLHITALLLAIFGLPEFFEMMRDEEPQAVTVEILPIGEISNVPNNPTPTPKKEEKQKPKEEVKPEEKPKPEEKKKEKEVPKTKQDTPPPPPEEKKKDEKKKEEVKKEEEKKKKKPVEDDLDAVLKSVEKDAQKEKSSDAKKDKETSSSDAKSKSDQFDPSLPLTITEKDAIRSQIEKNWSPPIGAKQADNLKVKLEIQVQLDGTVTNVEVSDMSRYNSDGFFRAAADSAVRAVWKSSPLKQLDQAKFQSWKEMELVFDPKDALY